MGSMTPGKKHAGGPGETRVEFYRCGCGFDFELALGKYGCPNCCGDFEAEIQAETHRESGENAD